MPFKVRPYGWFLSLQVFAQMKKWQTDEPKLLRNSKGPCLCRASLQKQTLVQTSEPFEQCLLEQRSPHIQGLIKISSHGGWSWKMLKLLLYPHAPHQWHQQLRGVLLLTSFSHGAARAVANVDGFGAWQGSRRGHGWTVGTQLVTAEGITTRWTQVAGDQCVEFVEFTHGACMIRRNACWQQLCDHDCNVVIIFSLMFDVQIPCQNRVSRAALFSSFNLAKVKRGL